MAHSRSPLIHELFARQTGHHLTYELIDAEPAQFETAVRGFQAAGGRGMNVTVPHKEAAFAIATAHGEAALVGGHVLTSFAQFGAQDALLDGRIVGHGPHPRTMFIIRNRTGTGLRIRCSA